MSFLAGDQVNRIGTNRHPVFGATNLHGGMPRQQLIHVTLEVRRQVSHDDKSHPQVGRDVIEKLLERFQATGGSTDADDGKGNKRREG